jgi:hypothetical protein
MLARRIAQHTAAASHQNLSCQQISSIAGMWAIPSMIDPFPFDLSAAVVAMFHSMNQSRHDLKAGENSSFSAIDVLFPPWTCTWPGGFTPSTAELWDETPGVGWYCHMLCTLCLYMIYIYICVCVCTHYTLIHVYCAPYMCIVHHICNTHTCAHPHNIYIYIYVCARTIHICTWTYHYI